MKVLLAAAVALLLAIPAAASAAVVPVTSLSGDFGATNSTLRLTPDGVNFGVYPTAESGGSLYYGGANGLTLNDVADLTYTFEYTALHEPGNYTAAPYLRIFTDGADNDPTVDTDNADLDNDPATGADDDTPDVILDPSACATTPVPHNTLLTFDVLASADLRVGDDGCSGLTDAHMSWADVLATQGGAHITGIYITQGFAVGDSFSATVPQMTFNGDTFEFAAPVAGPAGPAGPAGGTVTIVQQPTQLTQTTVASSRLVGNTLRVLHAPKRKGERLLSVRAWLLTPTGAKRLPVDGRAIKVDLRRKPVGNYNVILKSKYRRKDGTVHTVRTTRNLSITPVA
jgi:opacity protein-like surface antigen